MGTRSRPPNILHFVADSARPDTLSCYGQKLQTSPVMDRLARDGACFECAISPSAWTVPAMASVFTGMVPTKHGTHDEHPVLDSDYPTIAELLQRAGYETAAFSDIPYIGPHTRLNRGFATMSNLAGSEVGLLSKFDKGVARIKRALTGRYQKAHESRVLFREVMGWLTARRRRADPFYLYVHSDETHAPYLPAARYRASLGGFPRGRMWAINQDKYEYITGRVRMTDEDFRDLRFLQCAEMLCLDEWFGRLLRHLERLDMLEHTVVVVMADHGDNIGEHGLMRHGLCLYDTLIRVPLIVYGPGRIPAARVRQMVQLIDLPPTFTKLAGLNAEEAEREFQGRDLVAAVERGEAAPFVVSELYRPPPDPFVGRVPEYLPEFKRRFDRVLRSWRTATAKLIWSSNGDHELYDLACDPGETKNVASERADEVRRLEDELEGWIASFQGAAPAAPAQSADDAALLERLRDLGYV